MQSTTKVLISSLLFTLALLVAGCHSGEDPTIDPSELPPLKEVTITETKSWSSVPDNVVTETFEYDINGRLTNHTITQNMSGYVLQTAYTVEYDGTTVTIEGNEGSSWIYQLNADGYAVSSTSFANNIAEREYSFDYIDNQEKSLSFLARMTETINDNLFSIIEFTPNQNGRIDCQISMHGFTDTIEMYFSGSNTSLLPNHLFIDNHPLCRHKTAIYAGILGRQTAWLNKLIPTNNEEKETITYSYTTDEKGWPTQCKETVEAPGYYINIRNLTYSISHYPK